MAKAQMATKKPARKVKSASIGGAFGGAAAYMAAVGVPQDVEEALVMLVTALIGWLSTFVMGYFAKPAPEDEVVPA